MEPGLDSREIGQECHGGAAIKLAKDTLDLFLCQAIMTGIFKSMHMYHTAKTKFSC